MTENTEVSQSMAAAVNGLADHLVEKGMDTEKAQEYLIDLIDLVPKVEALESGGKKRPIPPTVAGEAMGRIVRATGARTQVQLADLLGVRQSSISDAKKRGAIPDSWLISLLKSHNLNPGWIQSGEGPMYMVPAGERGAA